MTTVPNTVRGEVLLQLAGENITLKPEHARAIKLDDALPHGILGTLIDISQERTAKIEPLALIIHHLSDEQTSLPSLRNKILVHGIWDVAATCAEVLAHIARGSAESEPGEADAQSSEAIGSTGAGD